MAIPPPLIPLLHRSPSDPRPIVLATCGISGAGKSTLAKAITSTHPSFTRLSIDVIVHRNHGLYGIDYAREKCSKYQDEAVEEYDARLLEILSNQHQNQKKSESEGEVQVGTRSVVLDRSFWSKDDRERYRKIVEEKGGQWVLVYLKASKDVLWRRIQERAAKEKDADSAFEVTPEVLDGYWKGFEAPEGEDEVVLEVL